MERRDEDFRWIEVSMHPNLHLQPTESSTPAIKSLNLSRKKGEEVIIDFYSREGYLRSGSESLSIFFPSLGRSTGWRGSSQ